MNGLPDRQRIDLWQSMVSICRKTVQPPSPLPCPHILGHEANVLWVSPRCKDLYLFFEVIPPGTDRGRGIIQYV